MELLFAEPKELMRESPLPSNNQRDKAYACKLPISTITMNQSILQATHTKALLDRKVDAWRQENSPQFASLSLEPVGTIAA